MKLTKGQRLHLREKFGGLCAYCGHPLGDRWHADHIEPVERKLEFVRDGYSTRMRATGDVHRPERDTMENLNPACAPCNIDKHAMSLEEWRKKLARTLDVLNRNSPTYRHAVRFGMLEERPAPVVFYFERHDSLEESASVRNSGGLPGGNRTPDNLLRRQLVKCQKTQ